MQQLQTTVKLNHLRFYAYHGALPQENTVGGHYDVSLSLQVADCEGAVLADNLAATVNYADIYRLVCAVMQSPSQLLERVAGRILQDVFVRYHQVTQAEVAICKVNPPIGADCAGAEVTVSALNPWHKPVRLLVLDFDGTLADTSGGIIATMKATFEALHLNSVPEDDAIKQTIGLPLRESFVQLLPPEASVDVIDEAVAIYHRLFEEIGAKVTVAFPEVVETLRRLTRDGRVKAAIATSRGHASVERLCRSIGLADSLACYVAEDDVVEKKPHPEAVGKILQMTGVAADEALVVGDTVYDVQMGQAAGCRTCAVTYGNHSAGQLAEAGADILIDGFGQLTGLVV